ncbi:MAG: hypothetical protein RLZZ214_3593 [Verrucomicrobiota bacterium]
MVGVMFFGMAPLPSRADVPDADAREFSGMYQITSSTDPAFPMLARQGWFLDFGKGIRAGHMSGNVAVALRRNPSVKVRIMAWQYFPKQGIMVMGNPFAEGSNKAVAKGNWKMRPAAGGFVLERANYQMVLHRGV